MRPADDAAARLQEEIARTLVVALHDAECPDGSSCRDDISTYHHPHYIDDLAAAVMPLFEREARRREAAAPLAYAKFVHGPKSEGCDWCSAATAKFLAAIGETP